MRATRSLQSAAYVAKRLSKHFLQAVRHGRGMLLTNGNALTGRLAKSALDLGVPPWLSSPAKELITDNGEVRGALIQREGREIRIIARRGVVLACGGFPQDVARRKALFPHAPTGAEHYSPGPSGNTGDGLRLAESVGGQIDTTLPHAAAWVPVSITTRKDGSKGVMPHFIDRAKPGVIAVTANGRRITNEGNSYHDFVQAMVAACSESKEISAYLICDHRTLRKYGLGAVARFPLPIGHHLRSGYLLKGATTAELAGKAGIDPAGLDATVRAYHVDAREGKDQPSAKAPKPTIGTREMLSKPLTPASRRSRRHRTTPSSFVVGDLGTYAGLIVDRDARVLAADRRPIPGLYAVGNDIASVMGRQLSGCWHHARPALTFGHIAGCHLAGAHTGLSDDPSFGGTARGDNGPSVEEDGVVVMGEVA